MAALQSTLSKQQERVGASADESQQQCRKLNRWADFWVCPLDKDEILDAVFGYVGLGEYYYVAGVSRRWRGRYIKLCYSNADDDDDEKLWTAYDSTIVTAASAASFRQRAYNGRAGAVQQVDCECSQAQH
jgi:hypothetical protein